MSFSILTVGFIVYTFTAPFLCLYAFKMGVKSAIKPEQIAEERVFHKEKHVKQSKEMERMNQILSNIENYSGDGANQRVVK